MRPPGADSRCAVRWAPRPPALLPRACPASAPPNLQRGQEGFRVPRGARGPRLEPRLVTRTGAAGWYLMTERLAVFQKDAAQRGAQQAAQWSPAGSEQAVRSQAGRGRCGRSPWTPWRLVFPSLFLGTSDSMEFFGKTVTQVMLFLLRLESSEKPRRPSQHGTAAGAAGLKPSWPPLCDLWTTQAQRGFSVLLP